MSQEFYIAVNNIPAIQRELKEKIAVALEAAGIQAEGDVSDMAPVDTGRLANSITHRMDGYDTCIIGTNVEYAVYQELGTYKMSAANKGRGYMKPAMLDHKKDYANIIESTLKGLR